MQENIKITHRNRTIDGTFFKPQGLDSYPVIICSHGYNGHKTDFNEFGKLCAQKGIGAVCFTFCGGSARDVSGFATTDMTLFTEKEDLCAVLDWVKAGYHMTADSIFLFGSSQGGMISALVAEERAADIAGLLLQYPAFCIADNWNQRFPREEDIPDTQELWGMNLGRIFFETIRDFEIKEQIGGFHKPVLIMHGTEDEIVPISYGKWAAERYPKGKMEVFPGEGHGFSPEGTERVKNLALNFVGHYR